MSDETPSIPQCTRSLNIVELADSDTDPLASTDKAEAVIEFTVDVKGKPRDLVVVSASSDKAGKMFVDSLKHYRFEKPESPCRMKLPFHYNLGRHRRIGRDD